MKIWRWFPQVGFGRKTAARWKKKLNIKNEKLINSEIFQKQIKRFIEMSHEGFMKDFITQPYRRNAKKNSILQ